MDSRRQARLKEKWTFIQEDYGVQNNVHERKTQTKSTVGKTAPFLHKRVHKGELKPIEMTKEEVKWDIKYKITRIKEDMIN